MSLYTEETLVQTTTAEYLEKRLGWESVYAYNNETFGDRGLLGRFSENEVVLKRYLQQQLIKLNQGLPPEAYNAAVRKITETSAAQSLFAANREKYDYLRDGVKVSFHNDKGEIVQEILKVIDFNEINNNHFLCVREMWVKGDLYRRRPDIICFMNGLPVIFMELKNICRDIKAAYEKNFRDYLDTIPHLFEHNAFVILANGDEAKIGTAFSRYEHFHEWKRLSEDDAGIVDMETLLKGICSKNNLIDMLENFIVFDDSAGKPKKIMARNHQYMGVNKAIRAVTERKERNGKLGVFWHTQGAGKSYSMVFFARKIHRKLGGNFTFLILTDRNDLDKQIYQTFAGCGVVDNKRNPCRAEDGEHLNRLLTEHKTHIFSLIQKFNKEVAEGKEYTNRDDIIVITDEAHRTQYGILALNMRNALPNASYIGFTGTPLFKDDQITKKVFGDYVSTYDFRRAVQDKATVPLYYDARGEKLGLAINDLNERIAEVLERLEIDDVDVTQRLESELKREYHIVTAEKRLEDIAGDFVRHYSKAWETGKVMLVCIDKVTCVKMFDLISKHWKKHLKKLQKELADVQDEQDEIYLSRQIRWMEETRMAVVVSEEQGEVAKFRNWGVDITPHRRTIKQGMGIPESMKNEPQYRNKQRMAVEDAFKDELHPFRIAIVCAMWMTGFDVPCLSTLYLDKPLKAHTLMQAIARANRVNEGKNNGLIVDYCGILKNLRSALATFTEEDKPGKEGGGGTGGGQSPLDPTEDLLNDLKEAIELVRNFLKQEGASLDDIITKTGFDRNAAIVKAKEAANRNDETRKRFEVMCREVFKKFKACINLPGINEYIEDYKAINLIYIKLQKGRYNADISSIMRLLQSVVDEAIETKPDHKIADGRVYDISKINFELLRQEFRKRKDKRTMVYNLKDAIEEKLANMMQQNPLRTDLQKHYEDIIAEYNNEKNALTIEQTFEMLYDFVISLDQEDQRHIREGLDQESLAIFDLLNKQGLTPKEIKRIKKVAVELLGKLKEEKLRIDRWKEKEATRDAVNSFIHDFLWSDKTGLPESKYNDEEISKLTSEIYKHVYRVYPTIPSPYYRRGA